MMDLEIEKKNSFIFFMFSLNTGKE